MRHACHLPGCEVEVPRAKLICLAHWKLVPFKLQEAVLKSFNPQCCCGKPKAAYFRAAGTALKHVLELVGNTDPGAAYYVGTYFRIAERMDQGAK